MIIITKDNISNYLTEQDINIIDKNIKNEILFFSLNELIKDTKCKIIYNYKYYFISYNDHRYNDIIIIINNNLNDSIIYFKYKNKDKYSIINKHNLIIFVVYLFSDNKKEINYNNKTITYYYNNNYKLIKIGTKVKKIFLNYYYIYYGNYSSLYYYNNYFLLILKTYKYRFYIRIKSNLNNSINNLFFFVYIIITKDNISNYLIDQNINKSGKIIYNQKLKKYF